VGYVSIEITQPQRAKKELQISCSLKSTAHFAVPIPFIRKPNRNYFYAGQ
jgi:hypothetical protein